MLKIFVHSWICPPVLCLSPSYVVFWHIVDNILSWWKLWALLPVSAFLVESSSQKALGYFCSYAVTRNVRLNSFLIQYAPAFITSPARLLLKHTLAKHLTHTPGKSLILQKGAVFKYWHLTVILHTDLKPNALSGWLKFSWVPVATSLPNVVWKACNKRCEASLNWAS